MSFPPGIKAYLDDPSAILALEMPACRACGAAAWNVHECCERYVSHAGAWFQTIVFRLRCQACRATSRLLPDCIGPYLQHGVPTIATACLTYPTTDVSYRRLAIDGMGVPPGESLSTLWSSPNGPSPVPSTLFRWLERFARVAGAWWGALAPEVQQRLGEALRPPLPPERPAAKAQTPAKAEALRDAWHLLWLLGCECEDAWVRLLLFAPRRPPDLDHTGWLGRRSPVPP